MANERVDIESARRQAWLDWTLTGEFNDSPYLGAAKQAYNDEAVRIQRYWDKQGV
jgi:hypothetical protein